MLRERYAEVVVDIPIWALDRALTYSIPEKLEEHVRVGSVVRVTVRGRRVRGWVIDVHDRPPEKEVQPVAMVSGRGPVFDSRLLDVARELSDIYLHPLASFLSYFTPPRLSRRGSPFPQTELGGTFGPPVLRRIGAGTDPVEHYCDVVARCLEAGAGAIVCAPEVREGSSVLQELADRFGDEAAIVHSGLDPAVRSKSWWEIAAGKRRVVLGGRGAVFVPAMTCGAIIIHEEDDPSYKDQRSPYVDARVAAIVRARSTGAQLILSSRTPDLVTLQRAARAQWRLQEPERQDERGRWPKVELVEPAKRGLPRRVIATVSKTFADGGRTLVVLPRTEATLSGPGPAELIRYLGRVAPGARLGRADRSGLGEPGRLKQVLDSSDIVVATEAALAEVERPPIDCVVALGTDTYLKKPYGRAVEESFAALYRLLELTAGRHGATALLEVERTDHHVVQALTRGDYRFFAEREMRVRLEDQSPPFIGIVKLKGTLSDAAGELRALPGCMMLGPVGEPGAEEAILRIDDMDAVRTQLKRIVEHRSLLAEVDPRRW